MTALDAADLVVIAGRTLGISTGAALARMDLAAARDVLDEARPPGTDLRDPAAAVARGVLTRPGRARRPLGGRVRGPAVAALTMPEMPGYVDIACPG